MPIIKFSPTFNHDYYRDAHPELNLLDDDALTAHYEKFADAQGLSSCLYDRREFLRKILQTAIDQRALKTLEIGCDAHPFLVGDNVKYFELTDADALRANCKKIGWSVDTVPKKIHFVNAGGLYVMFVPDKRFCFDHFNADLTLADVINAFVNRRKNARRAEKYAETFERGEYVSAHNWRFTPDSFGYRRHAQQAELNRSAAVQALSHDLGTFRVCRHAGTEVIFLDR